MKLLTVLVACALLLPVPAVADDLVLGTHAPIMLQAWNFVDKTSEHLVVTDDNDKGAVRFHGVSRLGGLNWGIASTASVQGSGGQAVGTYNYGEVITDLRGDAWGANDIGITYSQFGTGTGVEANGVNRSGVAARKDQSDGTYPFVTGVYVVNGGNAPTNAAILIETAGWEPQGIPYVGINLQARLNNPDVASDTGIHIGRVSSGEALNTVAGQRIALTEDGLTFIVFDPHADQIKLFKHGALVGTW